MSSGGQDEANQVPAIERYCAGHSYSIERRYELNDKSASKGEQQEALDAMVHDMREGATEVLVCWHSDRLERRGAEALFSLLSQVRDAGGRIESAQEPEFGKQSLAGQLVTATSAAIAHEKSEHLREQVKLAHDRIRANGAVGPGGTPWGYRVAGQKYSKQLVPTDLCREYAPQVFDRCIAGESCREIAAWLDAEGVPPKRGDRWNEGTIRKMLHNRVYAGRWQTEDKKQTLARCEAVIPANIFDHAQSVLKRHAHRGPAKQDRPMLANLRCNRCQDSPMFRIRLRSRSGKSYYYYRCTGRGAQRRGCGNMTPYTLTEDIVSSLIAMTTNEPHKTRTWVEGTHWDAEISDVKQDIREAVEAEQFDKLPALQATLEDLRSRETVKGHWEYEDTGLTVGAYFSGLDDEGKREYLKTRDIRVEKASEGVRVAIDGEDYGVIRFASVR